MENKFYNVKNRSAGGVGYRIPEDGIRRTFAPGETKKISFSELEKLSFQSGGKELMEQFLQIQDAEVLDELGVHTELEYHMSEKDIAELIISGSMDQFLDFLDFAPIGEMDILKSLAVSIPLSDYEKRQALKEKTGFDVDRALANIAAEKAEEGESATNSSKPKRRVTAAEEPEKKVRRTYNVINTNKEE